MGDWRAKFGLENMSWRGGLSLLGVFLFCAGFIYLVWAPEPLEFRVIPYGGFPFFILAMAALGLGGLAGSFLDHLGWNGAMPAPSVEGYAWRRSIRSRLGNLGSTLGMWALPAFADMAQQAYFKADWPRTFVAAAMILGGLWVVAQLLANAFSPRTVLAIDREGIREGPRRRFTPWTEVERISVEGDLAARQVSIVTAGEGGSPARAWTLDLGAAGLPARRFLALVGEVAPQVEVAWPRSPIAAFS
jgi:hypothetical protein